MDFRRDELQTELCDLARRLLEARVTADFLRIHTASGAPFDALLWEQLHEAGLVTASVPAEAGGLGFGMLELGWILEAAGRVLAPVPLLSTAIGARALAAAAHARSDGETTRWLTAVMQQRAILALALMDASDDPLVPAVSARPLTRDDGAVEPGRQADDDWLLSGCKTAVAFGVEASALLVTATTPEGPALFLVPGNATGLVRHPQCSTHGEPWALVSFDDLRLPAAARLGGEDAVTRVVLETRAAHAAFQVGVAEAALRQTADYVTTRHQFGRPLGSMQAVQQRVADAYIDVEAMRSTSLLAAGLLDADEKGEVAGDGNPHATLAADVAVAAYWAAQAGHRVTHATQHLHGGMGADVEYPIHRYFLRAKATGLGLGGAQSLLARIGTEIVAGRIRRLSGVET